MNLAYIRVSTKNQDEKRQKMILQSSYRIDKYYIDKATGKNSDREQLNKLLFESKKDDIIYIESISRLSRNVNDTRQLIETLNNKGVELHFIKEGITTNSSMYKLLLTIFSAIAEMERETIQQRVIEGMEKARRYGTKSGKMIGRPPAKLPDDFQKYYKMLLSSKINKVECSRLLKISRPTLNKYIKIFEMEV